MLKRSDTRLNRDIAALVAAAERSRPFWPDEPPPRNLHVDQQAELALCKIYGVLPTAGETIRDARSTPEETDHVTGFWRRTIGATQTQR